MNGCINRNLSTLCLSVVSIPYLSFLLIYAFGLNKIFVLTNAENSQIEQKLRLIWLHKSYSEPSCLCVVSSLLGPYVKYFITILQTKGHRNKKHPQRKDDDIDALSTKRILYDFEAILPHLGFIVEEKPTL